MSLTAKRVDIRPKDLILPAFWKSYVTKANTIVEDGGRTSGKSTFVGSQKLVMDFMKNPEGNVICFRKYQNTLFGSCYQQISRGIYEMGLDHLFEFKPSRLRIFHRETGTGFYFFGLDDINKIKSTKIENGYPFRYWFEEFQENDTLMQLDIIEDVIVTFEREKLPEGMFHQTIYSLNRPRNPHHLINVWLDKLIEQNDPDVFIHSSTYLDVVDELGESLLSPEILRRINRVKERDPKTYQWRYLGQAVGEGLKIYNMGLFKEVDELPEDEILLYLDVVSDTGYQVSATTFFAYGVTNKRNLVVFDGWYYSPDPRIDERIPSHIYATIHNTKDADKKMSPSQLSRALWEFEEKVTRDSGLHINNEIIDSAEGALRNQFFNDYGRRLRPVNKLKKLHMVERSRTVASERQVYVFNKPGNQIWLWEMEKYQWKDEEELIINPDNPRVIKMEDHTCDTYQYWSVMCMGDIGLLS